MKARLDIVLGDIVQCEASLPLAWGLELGDLKVLSNPKHFMSLCKTDHPMKQSKRCCSHKYGLEPSGKKCLLHKHGLEMPWWALLHQCVRTES